MRTVRIAYRKTNNLEARDVCGSNNLVKEEVAVQRLQLLVSAGERSVVAGDSRRQKDSQEHPHEGNVAGSWRISKSPLRVSIQVDDTKYDKLVDMR